MSDNIRALRLAKNLSQMKIARALGLTESQIIRIERGNGKPDEVAKVIKTINSMPANDRKIAGRPFNDPKKNAETAAMKNGAVAKKAVAPKPKAPVARKAVAPKPKAPVKKAPARTAATVAKALAKKSPARAK